MRLDEVIEKLNLKVKTKTSNLDRDVSGGYVGDLLSDVMANAREGNVWITIQRHVNVIAVAVLKDLTGIILANNKEPEKETLDKAEKENIPFMVSNLSSFEIAGKLYQLLKEK
jgi:hypothetical protein